MTDDDRYLSLQTRGAPWAAGLARMLAAAVDAVAPAALLRARLSLESPTTLRVRGLPLPVPLDAARGLRVLAVGKASAAMARAALAILGSRVTGGVIVTKHTPSRALKTSPLATRATESWPRRAFGTSATQAEPQPRRAFETSPATQEPRPRRLGPLELVEGSHPVPDERSLRAGQRLVASLRDTRRGDLVLALISGGASSLVAAPRPPVTLADLAALTSSLLASGAAIDRVNLVRRHLDSLKGGGLVARARPARVLGLILSDVVSGPARGRLAAVGSGLTFPGPDEAERARAVLRGLPRLDEDVRRRALAAIAPSEPGLSDMTTGTLDNLQLADNGDAVRAAAAASPWRATTVRASPITGEARDVGVALARELVALAGSHSEPTCVVLGGETTVTRAPTGARGGRNQELALAAALELERLGARRALGLVSLATDGEDGTTDVAGAIVDADVAPRARALGLDPEAALREHESYALLSRVGALVRTGPTGTNVCDLIVMFTGPPGADAVTVV